MSNYHTAYPPYAYPTQPVKRLRIFTRKILYAVILIAVVAGVSGGVIYYQFILPHVRLTSWEIVLVDDKPALKVGFRTNVFPILVKLIGPDRKTVIDEARAEIPEDIPVILYLPVLGEEVANVVPGTYYLRFIYKDKVVLYESVDVKLGLEIVSVAVDTDYFPKTFSYPGGWYITGVNMTVKNTGNSPVRINNVHVIGESGSARFWLRRAIVLEPGHQALISAEVSDQRSAVYLGGVGTYEVEVSLELGPRAFSHRVKVRAPAPRLVVEDLKLGVYFSIYAEAWRLNNITLTIRNTGTWTIYVYAIEVVVVELQASDSYRFFDLIMIEPGETKTIYADLYIKIPQPGGYNVTISLDLSPDSWLIKTTLEIKAPLITIKDVSFSLRYYEYTDEWELVYVTVTLENTGEADGYVYEIWVEIEGVDESYDYFGGEPIRPGETKTLTAYVYIWIEQPGTYNVTVKVDLGFTTITYETVLTVS